MTNDLRNAFLLAILLTLVIAVLATASPPQSTLPVRVPPPQSTLPPRPPVIRPNPVVETPARVTAILVPQGVSPPSAPSGWTWVRVSCSTAGCTYRLTR